MRVQRLAREQQEAWKALSDPTRRSILDLLREGPMTTGSIVEHFDLTRFGVMKHLSVLVEAGLVVVRRSGRERWNELNPIPIHQIARRWIKPFEVEQADRLIRLKRHAETQHEAQMTDATQFRALDIKLDIEIAASPKVVWESLTKKIGEWWPKAFYVGTAPKRFAIEPQVGGRVFEDWGYGEGALFGTVIAYHENEMLQWAGDMSAEFGGPARSVTTFRLKPSADGTSTTVMFRDTPFGLLSDGAVKGLQQGWNFLMTDCFKPFVEDGKQPERPESLEN